jgi:hypothetical protein
VPDPIFIFCAPGVISRGTEGVRSRFQALHTQTCFQRYCGHRVSYSCFALSDSFSAVLRVSGPVFMFCTPELIFGGTECVGSRFHILRAQTSFSCPEDDTSRFFFCTPGLVFGGAAGVGSLFHVLLSRTRFWRYRGRRVLFSCFARHDSFSMEPRVSSPIFMFFSFLDSFSAVRRVPDPVFMFCVPELIFGGTEGIRSNALGTTENESGSAKQENKTQLPRYC